MFTIISWYTKHTEYESVMMNHLVPSLLKLNLPHSIYPVDSKNDWKTNTNMKPEIVEQAFEEIETDLLIVDADAIIHCYPKLLEEIPEEYDCAIFWLNWNEWYQNGSDMNELCSGTLYFRNRPICKKLIKKWKEVCAENRYPDQKNLEVALKQTLDINVYKLPYEYCWIHSLPGQRETYIERPNQVVVEHFQVSRQLKRKI